MRRRPAVSRHPPLLSERSSARCARAAGAHGLAKVCGIAISIAGAAIASYMNGKAGEDMSNPTLGNVPPLLPCPRPHAQLTWLCAVCAQIFFFLQCFFGSTFFLLQKSVLSRYPPLQTTCWGYCMGACILVLVVIPQATEAADWHISTGQGLAVLYAIFIQSVRTSRAIH